MMSPKYNGACSQRLRKIKLPSAFFEGIFVLNIRGEVCVGDRASSIGDAHRDVKNSAPPAHSARQCCSLRRPVPGAFVILLVLLAELRDDSLPQSVERSLQAIAISAATRRFHSPLKFVGCRQRHLTMSNLMPEQRREIVRPDLNHSSRSIGWRRPPWQRDRNPCLRVESAAPASIRSRYHAELPVNFPLGKPVDLLAVLPRPRLSNGPPNLWQGRPSD